jgi:hypothetical protein
MIEPAWKWIKWQTSKGKIATLNKDLKEAWVKCWQDLLQEMIQHWIENIMIYIPKIILLKGGNEYKEGSEKRRVH